MCIQKLLLTLKNANISTKGCLGKFNGYFLSVCAFLHRVMIKP